MAIAAVSLLAAGCAGESAGPSTSADPTPTTPTPTGEEVPMLVDGSKMLEWVETIVSFGIRRPGYPGDDDTIDWIADEFASAGLDDVRLDPVEVNRWTPDVCSLTYWPDDDPSATTTIPCFALPYSNPEVDLTAPIALDDGTTDIDGSVAVVRNEFREVPQAFFVDQALEAIAPDEFLETDAQPVPFGFRNNELLGDFFASTEDRGGAGLIGVLTNLGTDEYYAPYTGENRDLPAVWVGEDVGDALLARAEAGPTTVRLEVKAEREVVTSSNVVAELPGRSDNWVVIASHHDSPWASAVQDGTGVAMVLAQARYWASVPEEDRPNNLLFVATAGHMAGAAGTFQVVEDYPEVLDRTVLEVNLEHVALRASLDDNGDLVVSDESEVRWWFTTDRPDLQALVSGALRDEGLNRDLILPAVGFFGAEGPLSDAAPFVWADVPIVSLVGAPLYLFDTRDTPDKVDVAAMESVTSAVIEMIKGTTNLTETR